MTNYYHIGVSADQMLPVYRETAKQMAYRQAPWCIVTLGPKNGVALFRNGDEARAAWANLNPRGLGLQYAVLFDNDDDQMKRVGDWFAYERGTETQVGGTGEDLGVGAGLTVAALLTLVGIGLLKSRKPRTHAQSRSFMRMAGWQGHSKRLMGSGILG